MATTVDNLRFVDSSVDSCQWFYREVPTRDKGGGDGTETRDNTDGENVDTGRGANRNLIFVFGSESDNPEQICQAVREATSEW